MKASLVRSGPTEWCLRFVGLNGAAEAARLSEQLWRLAVELREEARKLNDPDDYVAKLTIVPPLEDADK